MVVLLVVCERAGVQFPVVAPILECGVAVAHDPVKVIVWVRLPTFQPSLRYNKYMPVNKNIYKKDYKLRKRAELRLLVLEYLLEHPCVECGEADPIVLDFDHLDRDSKLESVARLVNNCRPWDEIYSEIQKCRVLCANCHRRWTHVQLNFWKQL